MDWEPENEPAGRRLATLETAVRRARRNEANEELIGVSAEKDSLSTIKILTGPSNPDLAQRICDHLGVPLGLATVSHFEDGEVSVRINENIRGSDVFIVQSTDAPADNLMELLVMLDAAKRASARRVTAVMPYFGYARQDRKDQPRAPITAKLVANLITVAGADRVLTMDLHSAQIQGFFDIPFDHLYAAPVLIEYFLQKSSSRTWWWWRPTSAASRWRAPTPSASAPSWRWSTSGGREADAVEVMNIIGDVEGKNVRHLRRRGHHRPHAVPGGRRDARRRARKDIYAGATHGVLLRRARSSASRRRPIEEVVVTDTHATTRLGLNAKVTRAVRGGSARRGGRSASTRSVRSVRCSSDG